MISSKKKSVAKVLRAIIVSILVFAIFSFCLTKVIYDATFPRYNGEPLVTSDELQNIIENRQAVSFESGKNVLKGYYYAASEASALVVIAPGYGADDDQYLWQVNSFLDCGWSVFSFDSTGHCDSEGDSAIGFSQELLDLEAALDFIEGQQRFGCEALLLFGHSRGGYAVCGVLDRHENITAVVSVSGINSAMEAIMEPAARRIGFIAYGNYPLLWLYQSMLFGADVVNIQVAETINATDVPVLLVHGTQDASVPIDRSSIMAHRDQISSNKVEYYLCDQPGQAGHTDLLYDADGTANDVLMEKINDFYKRSIKTRG